MRISAAVENVVPLRKPRTLLNCSLQ